MKSLLLSLILLILSPSVAMRAQQLAFPGAEGFGRYAVGGRGGKVVEVTNLYDKGTGSLRYALENMSGPRTVVFRVGGIINLQSKIEIKDDAYITIAGQTAPGDGICIKNYPLMINQSHDIIVRYFRSRLGDKGDDDDALSIRNCKNVIVDHCSLSWSVDAIFDVTHQSSHITAQWNILSEALWHSHHEKGGHSMGTGWDGKDGCSYHHNLISNCNSRTPRLDKYTADDGTRDDLIDIINNVIYNWDGYGAYGGENADVNWIGNYYKYGPNTSRDIRSQIFKPDGDCKVYVAENFVDSYPGVTADNSKGINTTKALSQVLVSTPFETDTPSIESAEEAFNSVLAKAGASFPVRDAVDTRIVSEVKNRKGSIIDSQSEVGGWPAYANGDAPTDTDKDGMPDEWETEQGLDMNDASDRNGDMDEDGYTNLEEYLNSLVEEQEPPTSLTESKKNTELFNCQFFALSKKLSVNLNSSNRKEVSIDIVTLTGKTFPIVVNALLNNDRSSFDIDVSRFSNEPIILLKVVVDKEISCKKVVLY